MFAKETELSYDRAFTYMSIEMSTMRSVFYLTGSRFFGTSRQDSDYDFFTACDADTIRHLLDMGFVILSRHNYIDSNTLFVLRYISENLQVDVQIESDVLKKNRAQSIIKRCGQLAAGKLSDAGVKAIWNEVYSLLD